MKLYSCCGCGVLRDKQILDNNKGCCSKGCLEDYKKTDRYKEIERSLK